MEIQARVFFSLWAITGFLSLYLGMGALERTGIPNSIPPAVMYFFKISLLISVCHSSTYALVFRPKLIRNYYLSVLFVISPSLVNFISAKCISVDWVVICGQLFIYPCYYLSYRKNFPVRPVKQQIPDSVTITILFILVCFLHGGWFGSFAILILNLLMMLHIPTTTSRVLYINIFKVATMTNSPPQVRNLIYFLDFLLVFVFFTSTAWAAISGAKLPNLKRKMRNHGRVTEFAIGMAGTIIFQNYFRLTSFDHVLAFLYLAVAWLANLAMLLCPCDLGIFNFILGNVIVGCTVSEFGLRATTWVVYGTCILLYKLRVMLEALSIVDGGLDQEAVIFWDARE